MKSPWDWKSNNGNPLKLATALKSHSRSFNPSIKRSLMKILFLRVRKQLRIDFLDFFLSFFSDENLVDVAPQTSFSLEPSKRRCIKPRDNENLIWRSSDYCLINVTLRMRVSMEKLQEVQKFSITTSERLTLKIYFYKALIAFDTKFRTYPSRDLNRVSALTRYLHIRFVKRNRFRASVKWCARKLQAS